jgi:spore coat polysaccharide biosynthesis protein SpsF
MRIVAVIQARMGSNRLPGKMMLPLGEKVALTHVIERTAAAASIDEVILATTHKDCDRLLVDRARRSGVSTYCGDERDVLSRMMNAAIEADADVIVRIAGDCPFVSPAIVDHAVKTIQTEEVEYASNKLDRTFPFGLDVETFTMESFERVERESSEAHEREHVTVYYLDNPDKFETANFTSDDVFDDKQYVGRTDLELVLDEAADYFYLDKICNELPPEEQDVQSIIDFIDERDLGGELTQVTRKTRHATEDDGPS